MVFFIILPYSSFSFLKYKMYAIEFFYLAHQSYDKAFEQGMCCFENQRLTIRLFNTFIKFV